MTGVDLLLRLIPSGLTALGVGLLTLSMGRSWCGVAAPRLALSRAEQRRVRQAVAELAASLHFHLDCGASLSTAWLLALDEHAADSGLLWQRLRVHRDLLTIEGPEAYLRTVAAELSSPELRRLLGRVREEHRHQNRDTGSGLLNFKSGGDYQCDLCMAPTRVAPPNGSWA